MNFQQRVAETILKMPTALRKILDAELDAGNEVAELESGDVTGSVVVRLHHAFRRLTKPLPMGIVYSEHLETDPMVFEFGMDDGLWSIRFMKFKPGALPSIEEGPDPRLEHVAAMKIVQAREEAKMRVVVQEAAIKISEPLVKGSHQFTDAFGIEADFRGETIRYTEDGRHAEMMWTWASDYSVYPDTMGPWQNADGTSTPMSDSERETVLQRVLKYGVDVQGVKMRVR